MPGIALVRNYNQYWLKADLVAGITVFAILVPSCLAYGELAGFEPVIGLYAALVAMIAYALFGSSRQLIVGPDATIAILIAMIVTPLAFGDSARYAALAAALTILIGLICLIGGYFKFGFVADFLSKPILTGYIAATALIVIVSQLGKIFGIEIVSDDFFAQILELITKLDQTHFLTLAVGLVTILGLILLKRFVPRVPAPLVAVVVAIIVSSLFNFADLGVSVVGQIPSGLPTLQIPQVGLADFRTLLPAALALTVLIFADELLVARVFAKKNHYELDPNQELTALGAANVSCGLFQSFAIGASSSRTVVNDDMHGKSQMVGVIAAGLVILFLLLLTSILQNLPKVVLGAIIIVAAISLIDVQEFRNLNLIRHSEFYLSLLTLFGVLIIGIVSGIAIAIAFSLAEFLLRIYRPHTSVLGTGEGVDGYHVIEPGGYNQVLPGLIVYEFNAPLFFANAPYLLDQVRDLLSTADPPVKCLLLDAEAIPDIDTTAADTLKELHQELQEKGIILTIARANKPLRKTMRLTGLEKLIGAKNFYSSVRTGVEAFRLQSLESDFDEQEHETTTKAK